VEKRILRCVFCITRVAQHPPRNRVQPVVIRADKQLEGVAITGLRPNHECPSGWFSDQLCVGSESIPLPALQTLILRDFLQSPWLASEIEVIAAGSRHDPRNAHLCERARRGSQLK
jgi:hypothetical protein